MVSAGFLCYNHEHKSKTKQYWYNGVSVTEVAGALFFMLH